MTCCDCLLQGNTDSILFTRSYRIYLPNSVFMNGFFCRFARTSADPLITRRIHSERHMSCKHRDSANISLIWWYSGYRRRPRSRPTRSPSDLEERLRGHLHPRGRANSAPGERLTYLLKYAPVIMES